MASTHTNSRRLIEDWFPVNEISIEAIRERAAASALPPLNWLHVWWSRKPLVVSRAAVAASVLSASQDLKRLHDLIGTHPNLVQEQQRLDEASAKGIRTKEGYSKPRAFRHNLTQDDYHWLQDNLFIPDPVVLDVAAGGGSIPFEAGRLGFRTIANELNPVAGLILRATCEWPQKYGWELREHFQEVRGQFLDKVRELAADLYPEEPQPEATPRDQHDKKVRAKRYVWAYLFARTVTCPSCEWHYFHCRFQWRLDSKGTGIRLIPDAESYTCSFEIVTRASEQSPGTVSRAKATCPYPNCGATTSADYISTEAKAGRLGHQLYCIIYRDTWYPMNKSGRPAKRPKTSRGFRVPTADDDNTELVKTKLAGLAGKWERDNILPNEGNT